MRNLLNHNLKQITHKKILKIYSTTVNDKDRVNYMQNIELLFEAKETMVFLFPFKVTLARKIVQVWPRDTVT